MTDFNDFNYFDHFKNSHVTMGHACKAALEDRTHRVLLLEGSMKAKFTNDHE
jgi:hypothetical protein